ncbi:spirocyclase AveC family protein [Kitasatospora sp. NPDC059973]|uniref:spirocyclase AveC family protein n=1 Tax=unclassified Kitasatospora TaxID=2633591 RepID=UPI00331D8B5E
MTGAVLLTAEAWVMGRWAIGSARWIPAGAYGLGPARARILDAYQLLSIAGVVGSTAWSAWYSLRQRALAVETMVLIGFLSAFWLMPVVNYHGQVAAYSKHLIATDDWGAYLPGWHGPSPANHPQPLFVGWFALAEAVMWALPTLWVLGRAERRRPGLSTARLTLIAFTTAMAVEVVLEPVMVFSGAYVYAQAVPQLTVFGGHWYQVPVYAMVIAATVYGVLPALLCHHHRHRPRGASVLRGLAALPPRARTWTALLAVVGVTQTAFLVLAAGYALIPALAGADAVELPPHLR